ncbi:hypothetical protein OROGR_032379 [Orobanche gracilis]
MATQHTEFPVLRALMYEEWRKRSLLSTLTPAFPSQTLTLAFLSPATLSDTIQSISVIPSTFKFLEFDNIANVDRPANPEAETSEEKASSIDISHGFSEFSQSGDSLRFGGSVNFLSHIDGGSYSSVENYHAQAGRKLQLGPPQEDLDLCGTTNLAFIRGESIFLVMDSRATNR